MISAPAAHIHTAEANASNTESHKSIGAYESEEKEKTKCLSGFIFLCNQSTKYECYRYRVFGLPLGRKNVVEEIKPGAKLFLFDFEVKRLYGVYEATSAGNLYLEPEAFGGKYPAQVKFRIFKECLPILENSLREIIKENYTGKKFKQELSGAQVTKLISSFRPLLASQALANKSLPVAMPPSVMENQLEHITRLPLKDVPYSAGGQYGNIQPSVEPRPALNINYRKHGSHIRDIREAISTYGAHPQPSFSEDVAHRVQDPSYSRYTTSERGATHNEVTISGRQYYQLPPQSKALHQNTVSAYNSNSTAADPYVPSQPYASYHQFPHHSSNPAAPAQPTTYAAYLPLQNEALHQANVAAHNSTATDQYAPPLIQTQHYASNSATPVAPTSGSLQQASAAYFPLQNEAPRQDNAASYNPNSTATDQYTRSAMQTQHYASYHQYPDYSSNHAAPAQHTASDSHQQVLAAYPSIQTESQHQDSATQYNSNLMALAQYASSVLQTQVPVHYGQQPLHGAQYQGSADPYSSNPEALAQYTAYQHNVAAYYSNPAVAVQYASIQQPQVSATNLPSQSEALHGVSVASYNSNPTVGNQYTPSSGQPEVLGHAVADGSAPTALYYPYAAAEHPSR